MVYSSFITKTRSTLLSLREKYFDCDVKVTYTSQNSSFTIVRYAGTETSHANLVDRKVWKHLLHTAMFSTTTLCCKDVSFVVVVVVVVVVAAVVLMNAFPSLLVFWVSMEVKMDFVRILKVQVKSNTPLFHSKENVGATHDSKNQKQYSFLYTRIKNSQFKGTLLQRLNFSWTCRWFYKDFTRGLSQSVLLTLFSRALSRVSVWHHW